MKFNVFAYKDTLINTFRTPIVYDKDVDSFIDDLMLSLKGAEESKLIPIKDNQLWIIGQFDNKTGEFIPGLNFVADLAPIIDRVIHATETKEVAQ